MFNQALAIIGPSINMKYLNSQKEVIKALASFATIHQDDSPYLIELAHYLWVLHESGVKGFNNRLLSDTYGDFQRYVKA